MDLIRPRREFVESARDQPSPLPDELPPERRSKSERPARREKTLADLAEGRESPAPDAARPSLESFTPAPVLAVPAASALAVAGSGWERAQAAALAERVLTSVRVGGLGGEREVRLGLGRSLEGVEVRLRLEEGRLVASLHTDGPDDRVQAFAARLERELRARGIEADSVAIVD